MCRVSGCYRPSTKFSHLCEYHRNVDRVHGDPCQKGITKAELRPYLNTVREYVARRSGPRVGVVISRDWERVVHDAVQVLDDADRGRPQGSHARKAAQVVVAVSREHHAMDVALLGMALGYFYADRPGRWASDRGFQYQAVRMLRRLARGETDYTWRQDGGMVRSSARRCPPLVTRAIWVRFEATNFIGYGIQIRREVEKQRELHRKDRIADLREILGPTSVATLDVSA